VVSNGSTPTQRTLRTTLAALPRALAEEEVRPPSVWVVGDVVGLTRNPA
jgi:uroporphyrin-III C-methyltransferase/precorrin-2 dehydrogenase/sirohydrochlorin ferrochelatase